MTTVILSHALKALPQRGERSPAPLTPIAPVKDTNVTKRGRAGGMSVKWAIGTGGWTDRVKATPLMCMKRGLTGETFLVPLSLL